MRPYVCVSTSILHVLQKLFYCGLFLFSSSFVLTPPVSSLVLHLNWFRVGLISLRDVVSNGQSPSVVTYLYWSRIVGTVRINDWRPTVSTHIGTELSTLFGTFVNVVVYQTTDVRDVDWSFKEEVLSKFTMFRWNCHIFSSYCPFTYFRP